MNNDIDKNYNNINNTVDNVTQKCLSHKLSEISNFALILWISSNYY